MTKAGKHFIAGMAGQLTRNTAGTGNGVKVAGVGESDLVAMYGREA